MQWYFSPSKAGFYCKEIHGGVMPIDCVEISDELYAKVRGQEILVDETGRPALVPAQTPGKIREALIEKALLDTRTQRAPIMSTLDGLQITAWVDGQIEEAQAIGLVKKELLDLTKVGFEQYQTYEEMRQAVKIRYAQIAASAPLSVKKAFKEALS